MAEGVLTIGAETGCTCREWSLMDVDLATEAALIGERQRDAEEYCAVVAAWNARVLAAPADARFDFREWCDYLLAAYDDIAARQEAEA
jgi:hypothetical protein